MKYEYLGCDSCPAMGVNQDDFTGPPPDADPAEVDAKWYEQPVDWLLDLVGNVNYLDENVRVSTNDGVLTIDRSGQHPTAPPPPAPVIRPPAVLQQIPTPVWWAAGGILALMLLRR